MTKRDIARLGCKLLALAVFLASVGPLAGALPPLFLASGPPSQEFGGGLFIVYGGNVISSGLSIVACLILLLRSGPIAESMIKEDGPTAGTMVLDGNAQRFCFSLLGVWALLEAIPQSARLVFRFEILNHQSIGMLQPQLTSIDSEAFALTIQIVLGLCLMFGSSGLVRLIRGVGRDGPNQPLI